MVFGTAGTVPRITVGTTRNRWMETAWESLADLPRSGAPRKLAPEQVERLAAWARDKPLSAPELLAKPLRGCPQGGQIKSGSVSGTFKSEDHVFGRNIASCIGSKRTAADPADRCFEHRDAHRRSRPGVGYPCIASVVEMATKGNASRFSKRTYCMNPIDHHPRRGGTDSVGEHQSNRSASTVVGSF